MEVTHNTDQARPERGAQEMVASRAHDGAQECYLTGMRVQETETVLVPALICESGYSLHGRSLPYVPTSTRRWFARACCDCLFRLVCAGSVDGGSCRGACPVAGRETECCQHWTSRQEEPLLETQQAVCLARIGAVPAGQMPAQFLGCLDHAGCG